jgi:hypothetical protein
VRAFVDGYRAVTGDARRTRAEGVLVSTTLHMNSAKIKGKVLHLLSPLLSHHYSFLSYFLRVALLCTVVLVPECSWSQFAEQNHLDNQTHRAYEIETLIFRRIDKSQSFTVNQIRSERREVIHVSLSCTVRLLYVWYARTCSAFNVLCFTVAALPATSFSVRFLSHCFVLFMSYGFMPPALSWSSGHSYRECLEN